MSKSQNTSSFPDDVRIAQELSFKSNLYGVIVNGVHTFSLEFVKNSIYEMFNVLKYNENE